MNITAGGKTSEFWVVLLLIANIVLEHAGVYELISPEQALTAAEQVQELARQLRGETGSDSSLVYVLASIYVGGRTLLKWRKTEEGGTR